MKRRRRQTLWPILGVSLRLKTPKALQHQSWLGAQTLSLQEGLGRTPSCPALSTKVNSSHRPFLAARMRTSPLWSRERVGFKSRLF